MPRVVLMCGPAGSGKSTVARGLEEQGFVRLSFDTEIWRRGLATPLEPAVHAEIEATLQDELLRHVAAGTDVVLDFSFWSREMRARYRALLAPDVVPETWYLDTDRATALGRVRARTGAHADDVPLSPALAARYFDHFEVPDGAEGPLRRIPGGTTGPDEH